MTQRLWLAGTPLVCLFLSAALISGEASSPAPSQGSGERDGEKAKPPGRITGLVNDPSGAVIPRLRVEIANPISGFETQVTTDSVGRFTFNGLPPGRYQLRTTMRGFETGMVSVDVLNTTVTVNITLRIGTANASVEVRAPLLGSASETLVQPGPGDQAQTASAAQFLRQSPAVTLRENGALGSIPLLHGLGDERTRILVDGMTLSSACPNHMNPPASYIAPSHAARMTVMPGITPVSVGGDSLGGTIVVESNEAEFADTAGQLRTVVNSSGFYRSNSRNYGGSFTGWVAGSHLGFGYSGSWLTGENYVDGSGHKVTSSYAQITEHAVTLAAHNPRNYVAVEAKLHHVPYEGFPSAPMDMVRDFAESLNLHYRRSLEHGVIDSHVYWQGSWHAMNIGKDKSTFPKPMWMPMNTHGRDYGYAWKWDLPIADRHNLSAGNEVHRFVLDDRWAAVPGTGMAPDDFISMNHGRRTRMGWFAELTSEWNPRWTTLIGLRTDTVWMNTGAVHGYSMMYAADANAFNAADRARRDDDVDATAWVRYEPNASSSYELGYARKTRAPNLYERYAWSTRKMASEMIGWFGDGNFYVGNLALQPETAHTAGATASWHPSAPAQWEIKLAPFVTWLHDFIDVDMMNTFAYGPTSLAQLRFANHDARIAGLDVSGSASLWQNDRFGVGKMGVLAGWQYGTRRDSSTHLYQMMPPHVRIVLDEQKNGITGGAGIEVVDRKSRVDPNRHEQSTPGYALLDVHAGYQRQFLRVTGGADNLLNRRYELPLGGVNYDDFLASGRTNQLNPLTGRGRSAYFVLSLQF